MRTESDQRSRFRAHRQDSWQRFQPRLRSFTLRETVPLLGDARQSSSKPVTCIRDLIGPLAGDVTLSSEWRDLIG